jgi:hypothetical protein
MTASREYESSGIPLLIPQDYRGELLREHRTVVSSESVSDEESATEALSEITDRTDETHDVSATVGAQPLSEVNGQRESGSLLDGLYHLLIGETGAEEETLLLLAIALLLLWGHLDRGGLFDRSTWDGDDLALLLIGYLLLS